ncbi:hypothetical protein QTP88_019297 [Uroleucon formosanum]
MSARVRPKTRTIKCYRCLGYGHTRHECQGPDRSEICVLCAGTGHKALNCTAPPTCVACLDIGESTNHYPGSGKCVAYRKASSKKSPNSREHTVPTLDLVLKKGSNIFIVDVTVLFENRLAAFEAAAAEKRAKYERLRAELATQLGYEAMVVPFIIGALGSWDPNNDPFMRVLCSRSFATLMRKLCVSDTIAITGDIYIEHLSGVRQVRQEQSDHLSVSSDFYVDQLNATFGAVWSPLRVLCSCDFYVDQLNAAYWSSLVYTVT